MKERLAFDKKSARSFDSNGFLHVDMSPISKETVNEYYGREIPGWEKLGLDPERIYKGYRPGIELEKAAHTFNGLNILSEHIKDDAEDPPKEYIIGSMGTDANFSAPYLENSLIIKDADAIKLLDPEDSDQVPKREISASYRYDPVFKPGVYNGQRYDFIMTNIRGNHIALVEEGRAGSDVVVADQNPITLRRGKIMNPLKIIEDLIASLKAAGAAPESEETPPGEVTPDVVGVAEVTEEKPAEDADLEDALTELDMLIESIADAELAEKLKGVADAIRAAGGTDNTDGETSDEETCAKEKTAKDEEKDPKDKSEKTKEPTMDKKPKMKKTTAKVGGNVYNISLPLAMDAARTAKNVEAKINAKLCAVRECRPLIGDVDPMAFDSAVGIYRKALETIGRPTKVVDVTALREMVQLACDAKPKDYIYPSVSSVFANDAKGKDDPNFAGLSRIRRA